MLKCSQLQWSREVARRLLRASATARLPTSSHSGVPRWRHRSREPVALVRGRPLQNRHVGGSQPPFGACCWSAYPRATACR
eukprot:5369678-Alexandrium_andersonii.AAC.1